MMDYDVSLHTLVVLVVVISTSPRSSKTESGGERYRVFSIGVFLKTATSLGWVEPAWEQPWAGWLSVVTSLGRPQPA